ncbi:aminoglycoside phosphotransferase family protein [Halpernia frigidisoli]|uniref:Phosphotransferase enzyme family protein n=1 Tax=Halpernia frigidisoli TaxID=1125876 RepID=A0A1I3HK79_9FLAO|nr:aminoglycoside phosphotransferase family protein [Halpernia frigidisoli]SFI35987.1 Phosphotransferase enzyme family protein [Halpernia frigidisoli]
MTEADIITFFNDFFPEKAQKSVALPQSGSSRKNFIVENSEGKFVITSNNNLAENQAFFYFSKIFSDLNLNTPTIFTINAEENLYIQTFLGGETLSEIIAKEGESENVTDLVQKALHALFILQKKTAGLIDFKKTFEYESYNELPVLNDLFYFKNFFADVLELPYQKSKIISEFLQLTKMLGDLSPRCLMLRDFQARNIMVKENNVFFIDYQAAMEGPLMYDVISFLFQAKANFTENFKNKMLQYYFGLWQNEDIENQLKNSVKPLQLIRFLQVLGAYGFRGLVQKKSHFIASIPKGIENIQNFANSWDQMEEFPELKKLIQTLKLKS